MSVTIRELLGKVQKLERELAGLKGAPATSEAAMRDEILGGEGPSDSAFTDASQSARRQAHDERSAAAERLLQDADDVRDPAVQAQVKLLVQSAPHARRLIEREQERRSAAQEAAARAAKQTPEPPERSRLLLQSGRAAETDRETAAYVRRRKLAAKAFG